MKQTFIFIFLLLFITLSAQQVGVNIANPEYTLDVRSSSISDAGQFNISNPDKSKYIRFFSGSDTYPDPSMTWNPGYNLLFATFDDVTLGFTEHMRISSLGNVGIGITDPQASFDLKGGDWNLDAGNPGDIRVGNASHNLRIGVATGGGGAGISRIYSSSHLILGSANEAQMQINTEGETGFGTSNPNQKVHVNGKLKIGDDAKAPTEGTIRYNSTNNSFEGYDGTKWINLGRSSPYGVQSTINLPNSKLDITVLGKGLEIKADDHLIAIKSTGEKFIGWDYNQFPAVPIYETVIYIKLFQENSSSEWEEVVTMNSYDLNSDLHLGWDFDVTSERLLVGDPFNKKAYEYSKLFGFWSLTTTFTSPNTTTTDRFGTSVAMDGQQTIIGAPEKTFYPATNYGTGKAYIYDSDDNLAATLSGSGAAVGDGFGTDVDITENRAIVGAPYNEVSSVENAGSATVFNKLNDTWSTNSTYYSENGTEDDYFGNSVSIDGDYFCVWDNVEGIYNYAVEAGFWVLKEIIGGQESDYSVGLSRYVGFDKMVFINKTSNTNKIPYLSTFERDFNNFFTSTSTLINGASEIKSFDMNNDAIYTLDEEHNIFVFEY